MIFSMSSSDSTRSNGSARAKASTDAKDGRSGPGDSRPSGKGLALALALAAIAAAVLFSGHHAIDLLASFIEMQENAAAFLMAHPMLLIVLLAYMLLLAIPFVPGAELGLLLLVLLGSDVAPAVYGATVGGMTVSYMTGRAVPTATLTTFLRGCGLQKAARIAEKLATSDEATACRLSFEGTAHVRWLAPLWRYRCVALGLIINAPGSTLVGGGGGIALAAGMSRVVSPVAFIATVCVAVAPVPAGFWLMGQMG
ncbi:MAG: hypothetical protein AAF739_12200 [Pseudomonadota bacterium]